MPVAKLSGLELFDVFGRFFLFALAGRQETRMIQGLHMFQRIQCSSKLAHCQDLCMCALEAQLRNAKSLKMPKASDPLETSRPPNFPWHEVFEPL